MAKFKVLLTNFEYGRGMDGSLKDWLLKGYRSFFVPQLIENKILDKFKKIIVRENPDLICINEIKKNQISKLVDKRYQYYDIDIKYGLESKLRTTIFHKNNCNAFLSQHKLNFKKKFLKNGTKKLLYEIDLPDNIKIACFHFSLKRKTRQKQFKEIYEIYKNHPSKIICGDFNILYGFKELDDFIKQSGLKFAHQKPTFPSPQPSKFFDLVLYSPNLNIQTKILPDIFSDHLAVMIEIKL
ncbi:hypothetical protein K8R66_05185 [bacterium]|nr:hypothetical protein [bacterium]